MTARPNACQHCGADVGANNPPQPQHCGNCPPWRCDDCGQMCSASQLCPCWIDVSALNLADIKALFADDCEGPGFSLTLEAGDA